MVSVFKGIATVPPLAQRMLFTGLLMFPFFTLTQASAQTIDIVSFGARCNGGDDSGAVQSAINALPSGGTLLVSCQAGIGSRGIVLQNKQNATIKGTNGGGFKSLGPTSNAIAGISWSNLLHVTHCDRCAVRNLVFQMNNKPVAAIGLDYNNGAIVDGNSIYDTGDGARDSRNHAGPSAAIEAVLNTSNQYTNNLVQHTSGWYGGSGSGQSDGPRGMWIGNNGFLETSPLIANNTINDTFHTALATTTNNATITGNRVYDAGTTSANRKAGGACLKETNVSSNQMTISNNDFEFCGQGIQLDGAGKVTLQNNVIHGMIDSGIQGNSNNIRAIGNRFYDNKAAGVTVLGGQNWVFQGNTFDTGSTRQGGGIRLTSYYGIDDTVIQGNVIKNTVYGGVQLYDRGGKIDGVDIGSNTITGAGTYGIQIEEQRSGMIVNVSIHNNCLASNRSGVFRDTRSGGRALSAPQSASSCP